MNPPPSPERTTSQAPVPGPGAQSPADGVAIAASVFEQESDFRKQAIYLVVIDRFWNGNRSNDGVGKRDSSTPVTATGATTGVAVTSVRAGGRHPGWSWAHA